MTSTDFVLPFSLYNFSQKGRIVFLEDETKRIINQHNYPDLVNRYIIELLALLSVMASDTKTTSIVSLQVNASASSPISLIVADIESNGNMRAYARYDEEKVKSLSKDDALETIFENGSILFTVDFQSDRYQTIVSLTGKTLTESMQHYSKQSDQIPTLFSIYMADELEGRLATAIMIQQLPLSSDILPLEREEKIEQWVTISHFMNTLKSKEALSLSAETLLFRLFHEADLQCHSKKALQFKCRCSEEKIRSIIESFSKEEKDSIMTDGYITADCEFCSAVYSISFKTENI